MASRYGLAIRAADAGDAAGIAELFRSAGLATGGRSLAERLEAMASQAGAVLLAEEWGPPSGLIALNWSWTLTDEARVAAVSLLLVDPEQRRRGIARLLLKAASQAARTAGCGELRLSVPAETEALQAFCLATGFVEAGLTLARPLRKRS